MSDVMNGAVALISEGQVVAEATKNPFDSRFNGHTDVIQDEEGYLWRIKEDLDEWMHKANTVKKSLKTLRENGAKDQLQTHWDKNEFDELVKKWQKIKAAQLGTDNIPALADKMIDSTAKMKHNSGFRVGDWPEAEIIIKQLLESGMKASAIVAKFTRPRQDEHGKQIQVQAIKLPSIISRRNALIYDKWVEGEKDLLKLAGKFKLNTDTIKKIIEDKGDLSL